SLAGNNTYSGDTRVNAGRLYVTTASSGTGAYSSANGTTLGVNVTSINGSLTVSTLSLGSSTASTVEFQNLNSTTVPAISGNNLTVTGAVTVNITGGPFIAAQNYPLIGYTNLSGTGGFVLGTLPPGVNATLVTNSSPISLQVNSVASTTPTN